MNVSHSIWIWTDCEDRLTAPWEFLSLLVTPVLFQMSGDCSE